MTFVSDVLGYVTLGCYIVLLLPQIYNNWKRKSGEGFSLSSLAFWCVGDATNLAGSIMNNLLVTSQILAAWYLLMDIVLAIQIVYYRRVSSNNASDALQPYGSPTKPGLQTNGAALDESASTVVGELENKSAKNVAVRASAALNSSEVELGCTHQSSPHSRHPSSLSGHQIRAKEGMSSALRLAVGATTLIKVVNAQTVESGNIPDDYMTLGLILGWASSIIYDIGRVPMIWQHYDKGSTEGLSISTMLMLVVGNVTYTGSIFGESTEPEWIASNLPWLFGSFSGILLDAIILVQCAWYARRKQSRD